MTKIDSEKFASNNNSPENISKAEENAKRALSEVSLLRESVSALSNELEVLKSQIANNRG